MNMCPILVPVGHFEIDRNRPQMSSWLYSKGKNSEGKPEWKHKMDEHGKPILLMSSKVQLQTAGGVTSTWSIPRMDAASRHLRVTSGRDEDAEEPNMGGHLFAAMRRTLIESSAGAPIENLPLFLLWISPVQGSQHVVVVEFNTANGQITTPRGIFDPNYGWLGAQRAFNSLDFNQMLHSVFLATISNNATNNAIVLTTPGLIQAFQLRHVRKAKS